MNHLTITLILSGVLLLLTKEANQRIVSEWRAAKHQSLKLDLAIATSAIKLRSACSSTLTSACTAGDTIAVQDGQGNTLIAADGSSVLHGWSFKAECNSECSGSDEYCLMARAMSGGSVRNDPLTKKPLDWQVAKEMNGANIDAFSSFCSSSGRALTLIIGSSCYGFQEGLSSHPLVPSYAKQSHCVSTQRSEPSCPAGMSKLFSRVDRYGDEGRDFNWMTACY